MRPGPPSGRQVSVEDALEGALKASSLTRDGKPFHAVEDIGKPNGEYSGRVEIWWQSPQVYKLQISSPKFSETKLVNLDSVNEKDEGDYYPRWLENFVLALLDPVPVEQNFRGRGGKTVVGGNILSVCVQRDDRPGGITDPMTWAQICFEGDEPKVRSVAATNFSIEYKDWQKFDKKQIARTVTTKMQGHEDVVGQVTTLEELANPDAGLFGIKEATPPADRIATRFVSTPTAEGILEKAPMIEWPAVLEGKTQGYMIVYARTDRTGQVRETWEISSDQWGLIEFGMTQALRYKFKPLIANGVPTQMELPLVLHFVSAQEDGLPVLNVEQMKKQMGSCQVGELAEAAPGGTVRVRVTVNEEGQLTAVSKISSEPVRGWLAAAVPLQSCHFLPLAMRGKTTYYKGDVDVTVK